MTLYQTINFKLFAYFKLLKRRKKMEFRINQLIKSINKNLELMDLKTDANFSNEEILQISRKLDIIERKTA